MQVSTSYANLVYFLANYQSQMSSRNTSLQGRLSQLTQQLSQPLQRKLELAEAEKTLRENHEALQETTSALQRSRDEDHHRVDSLAAELAMCWAPPRGVDRASTDSAGGGLVEEQNSCEDRAMPSRYKGEGSSPLPTSRSRQPIGSAAYAHLPSHNPHSRAQLPTLSGILGSHQPNCPTLSSQDFLLR